MSKFQGGARLHVDPLWPRAAQWLKESSSDAQVSLVGVPLSRSITPGQCELAPGAVRQSLLYFSDSMLSGRSLQECTISDEGDLLIEPDQLELAAERLPEFCRARLSRRWIFLGGDNSVTRPGVHSLGVPLSRIGVITFDAHYDLRHTDAGLNNGNPIRALLNDGLPGEQIVQIGLQEFANSFSYEQVGAEHGLTAIPASTLKDFGAFENAWSRALQKLAHVEAIYVDFDLDVCDRSMVPACPGARPGGIPAAWLRHTVRWAGQEPRVAAIDLVEMDPTKDVNQLTSHLAAACVLEFCAGTLEQRG